jgi:AcrR family transcriptional regulator
VSKGEETRERILEHAFDRASRDGLEGLSIGSLALELGLSKSGLFAHFGSKEDLQVAVLDAAARRFEEEVVRPALAAPRGKARLKRWFDNWLRWLTVSGAPQGGCLFVAAAVELDDREGRPRDVLVGHQKQLMRGIAKAVSIAIEAGHLRKNVDAEQFAYEMHAIILGYNHAKRLLRDPRADGRARAAFDRLLADASTDS